MQQTIVRRYFNSFFVTTPDKKLVIDALELPQNDAREIVAPGGVAWVAITKRDRERSARCRDGE